MPSPTCRGTRVRSPEDAMRIFHGVYTNRLRMVNRRLDTEERRAISSGCVYVWEERSSNADVLGIERWTDSISWGPSRVKNGFLFYDEKRPVQTESPNLSTNPRTIRPLFHRPSLVKQTYSIFVNTHYGRRKWHMVAYFTHESADQLFTVDDRPALASLVIPRGIYTLARASQILRQPLPSSSSRSESEVSSRSTTPDESQGGRPPRRHNNDRSITLEPLQYLQAVAPPPRHAVDESAIMSFSAFVDFHVSTPRFEDQMPWTPGC